MEGDHDEDDQSYAPSSNAAETPHPAFPPLPTRTPGWMSHIPALPLAQLPRAPISFSFDTDLQAAENIVEGSLRSSSSFNEYLQYHNPAYAPPQPFEQSHRQEPSTLSQTQPTPRPTVTFYSQYPSLQSHTGHPNTAYPNIASNKYTLDPAQFQPNESDSLYTQNGLSSTYPLWPSTVVNSQIPLVPQNVEYRHGDRLLRPLLPSYLRPPSDPSVEPANHDLRDFGNENAVTFGGAESEAGLQSVESEPTRNRKRTHAQVSQDDSNVAIEQQEPGPKKRKKNRSRAMANIDPQLDNSTAEGVNEPTKSRKEARGRGRPKGQKTGLRPTIDPGPEFMTLYNQAMDAFIEQDDVILAQTKVLQAIGANPEIFAAHSLLADIHFAKGDHDKGLDALIGGLHAHMNDIELWRQVADTILASSHEAPQKRVERAMYCFGAILRKEPKDLDARFQRAECARLLGHVNRAFKDLNILLQDDPHNSSVLAQFTKLCQDVNDAPKAKIMYDEHFEYYKSNGISDDCFTWQDVGVYVDLLAEAGENSQAIIMLKRLSRWLCGRRDEDFWEEYLEDDREFDQNHYPRRLEVSQFEPNKYPEKDYGEALPLDLRSKLGILRLKLNYREEAQSHFDWLEPDLEEEESLVEEYSDNFLEIAKALYDAKEHREALRFYSALENSGIDLGFEFWIGLGASAYVCEQRPKALKAYEQALVVNPASIEARTQLAKLYRDLGDRPNALKFGREAVVMSQDAIPQTGNRKYENRENRLLREAAERALKGAYRLPRGPHGIPGKIPDSLKYRTRMKSKFFKYVPQETDESESEPDAERDGPLVRKERPKKFGPPKRPGRPPNAVRGIKPAKPKRADDVHTPSSEPDQARSISKEPRSKPNTARKRRYGYHQKQPSKMDPQKHYEDMQALYRNLLEYQSAMRDGDEEATSRWMDCAQAMVDDFRTVKVFFPGERHQKFTGYTTVADGTRPSSTKPISTTHSPTPNQSVPTVAEEVPIVVEESRSSTPIRVVDKGVRNDYCGIPFPAWLDIFLELALLTANSATFQSGDRDLQTDCYSIINAAIDCNVFYHHAQSLSQIYVVYLSCCLALNDDVTLYNTVLRWFMNEFTFCTDTYRLYSTVALLGQYSNVEGKSRIEGSSYRHSSNQKFLFRQLCSIDQQLPDDYGIGTDYGPVPGFMRRERDGLRVRRGKADDEQLVDKESTQLPAPVLTTNMRDNVEQNPAPISEPATASVPRRDRVGYPIGIKNFSPKEMDVVLFILYSHIMMANNSFTNALNYLYRAHSLDPSNTVCLLSIALCYLTELFKRQASNRHALSLMGWTWFQKYEEERRKWAERVDEQNAERTNDGGGSVAPNATIKMVDLANREIEFNKARCWEMMGMPDLAVRGYKKMLALPSTKKEKIGNEVPIDENGDQNGEEEPETWDMEAAYAMSTIYMINGDGKKAREIVEKYMVVEPPIPSQHRPTITTPIQIPTPIPIPILPSITSLPPVSSLFPSPIPPIDADSLVALNTALRFTPVEDLRDVIRSVCLSNLDVAAVLHSALCGERERYEGGGNGDEDEDEDEDGISESSRDVTPMGYTTDDGEEDDEEGEYPNDPRGREYWEMKGEEYVRDPRGRDYWRDRGEVDDSEGEEEQDEEELEAANPKPWASNSSNNVVPRVAVVDLTGDSDKENPAPTTTTATTIGAAQKRKAPVIAEDLLAEVKSFKKRREMAIAAEKAVVASVVAQEIHFKDRYKHCSNCYELFDTIATPCHPHKNGPKRTPGPRERMGGDNYGGDDDTENEEEDEDEDDSDKEDEDPCDCIYHPGEMWADDEQFVDHDENCHGALDDDWTKTEYPDNYIWDCCDQAGNADGCKMGRHEVGSSRSELARLNAAGGLKKRFRYTF